MAGYVRHCHSPPVAAPDLPLLRNARADKLLRIFLFSLEPGSQSSEGDQQASYGLA
jgi:hypothetical protein